MAEVVEIELVSDELELRRELERLAAVYRSGLLDAPPERQYDDLVLLAQQVCGSSSALLSVVGSSHQWIKARVGLALCQTPREVAFCDHVVRGGALLIVEDTHQDARFAENPLVIGPPYIRFYAGVPLWSEGQILGALAVLDLVPRALSPPQQAALEALGRQAQAQVELTRTRAQLRRRRARLLEHQRRISRLIEITEELHYVLEHTVEHAASELAAHLDAMASERADAATIQHHARLSRQQLTCVSMAVGRQRHLKERLAASMTLDRAPIDWLDLRDVLHDSFSELLTLRGQRLTIALPAELPELWADRDVLERMLILLLDNAASTSPHDAALELRITPCDDALEVSVHDQAPTLSPQLHEVMFSRGGRVAAHAAGQAAAWGAGLLFCRAAMSAHGGDITVRAPEDAPHGNVFTLRFTSDTPPAQ